MNKINLKTSLLGLDEWFCSHQRILPWRANPAPYPVWVSEIMLQQTQVKTVIPYFEKFIKQFPTVKSLAGAEPERVLLYWAGLGYYSRARNLHKSAKIIAENGFPETEKGWLQLPGVGRYTAGAVLSIAYNQPVPILDANVERVVSRLRRVRSVDSVKKRYWRLSRLLVEEAFRNGILPSNFNQALMELGALICTASGPQCGKCPFGAVCRAKERGDQEYFPVKPAKRKKVELEEVVFAVISGGRTLLYLDREKKWHKGLWDFPAVLPMEEENLEKRGEAVFQYTVTHHKISRKIIILRVPEVIQDFEGSEYRWVELTSSPSVPVGSPARKGLEIIKKQFNGRGFLF